MASEIRVYFEGDPKLRLAFVRFLSHAKGKGRQGSLVIHPIGCGSRSRALKSFALALRDHPDTFSILLVDAEDEVSAENPWDHLASLHENRLIKPESASDQQAHLMVQIMESWFLADRKTLRDYYSDGFLDSRIPDRVDVESIPKADVVRALRSASEKTKKGKYHKTVHGPQLLERIDPEKVRRCAPWCNRLFETLERIIEDQI